MLHAIDPYTPIMGALFSLVVVFNLGPPLNVCHEYRDAPHDGVDEGCPIPGAFPVDRDIPCSHAPTNLEESPLPDTSPVDQGVGREVRDTGSELVSSLLEAFQCSICVNFLAFPVMLPCGHTFCGTCVVSWYFARVFDCCGWWHDPPQCPNCRAPCDLPQHEFSHSSSPASRIFITNLVALNAITKIVTNPQGRDYILDYEARLRQGHELMGVVTNSWLRISPENTIRWRESLGVQAPESLGCPHRIRQLSDRLLLT
ncbi:hypothetical protein QCA50_007091 [Cerrena zonata]|uniref:RING-type domain-containing protein n=1 Tax=Cerrena zonata TaxID=2478898 RepID=A0AAW0GDS5_9APHY